MNSRALRRQADTSPHRYNDQYRAGYRQQQQQNKETYGISSGSSSGSEKPSPLRDLVYSFQNLAQGLALKVPYFWASFDQYVLTSTFSALKIVQKCYALFSVILNAVNLLLLTAGDFLMSPVEKHMLRLVFYS